MRRVERVRVFFWASVFVLAGVTPAVANGTLTIRSPATFSAGMIVRDAIKNECHLLTSVPEYIQKAAAVNYSSIVLESDASRKTPGLVLELQISNLEEMGNRFMGRRKSMTVKGELFDNGKLIGSFQARRDTTGGIVGGYLGECSYFIRCATTIGKDIASWLLSPAMNSSLP